MSVMPTGVVSQNQWILACWSRFGEESAANVGQITGLGSRLQQILVRQAGFGLVSTDSVITGGGGEKRRGGCCCVDCRVVPEMLPRVR